MNAAITLRKLIREKRRNLPIAERQLAEQTIYHSIKNHSAVRAAKNIAIFLSIDGELNTQPIIDDLWQQNKRVYLPVIHPFVPYSLLFLEYTSTTLLTKNSMGILQPPLNVNHVIPYQQLDIIFTPLVAFDERGYRLGMGGGYYDRLLANYQNHAILPIGLAFACQKVTHLANQPWDIKLPEIIYA